MQQTTQQSVDQSLKAQQQAISGVDPNEELVKLLQYQRGFQMSSKFISVVNDTLTSLLSITTS
jgi:flagellar hook-associated protein 1 FlgK